MGGLRSDDTDRRFATGVNSRMPPDSHEVRGSDKGSVTYYNEKLDYTFLAQAQERFVKDGVMVHLQLNEKAFGFKCTPRFPYINIMKKVVL